MVTRSAVAAVLVTAAVAVPALAATPRAGSYSSGGEGGAGFTVVGSKILKGATLPSTFKCNKMNAVVPVAMKIVAGRAHYSGLMKGQTGKLVATITFTTSSKASVTATITKGACKSTARATVKLLPGVVGAVG